MAEGQPTVKKSAPRPALPTPPVALYDEARSLAARAPLPAWAGNIRVGSAGWSDPALSRAGLFYPKGVSSAEGRLRYYAEHFQLVEVDATYYALLSPDLVRRWADWTPPTFQFDVKAHPAFTGHPLERRRLPADLAAQFPAGATPAYARDLPRELLLEIERRYFLALAPLLERQRLTSVLLQFPPWFEATRGNVRVLEQLRDRYPDAPFSVEFRHRSWLQSVRRERVLGLLRALRFSYVVVDEPDVTRGGVPPIMAVTCERLAVLRFHGQNRAAWERPNASVAERFNYLYRADELAAWVERVKRLSDQAEQVHAVFNNCVRNYAILNAKELVTLLRAPAVSEETLG